MMIFLVMITTHVQLMTVTQALAALTPESIATTTMHVPLIPATQPLVVKTPQSPAMITTNVQ